MNFCESPGDVESHCAGPEEERNEGVVNDVAEYFAQHGSVVPLFVMDTEAVGDAENEVTDEGVNEETNRQDRAQLLLVLNSDEIHQSYQDEEGRD